MVVMPFVVVVMALAMVVMMFMLMTVAAAVLLFVMMVMVFVYHGFRYFHGTKIDHPPCNRVAKGYMFLKPVKRYRIGKISRRPSSISNMSVTLRMSGTSA